MRLKNWTPYIAVVLLIGSCAFPWVVLPRTAGSIGGFQSDIKEMGLPGAMHAILSFLYLLMILIGRVGTVRVAFFVAALNLAWAARNFFILSACRGGECPQKLPAIYVMLLASVLMIVAISFARTKTKTGS